jgi:hypothetical protein
VPTTRVADGADVVHPPPILRVPPIALNAARIDSPEARRPLVVTPQDASSLEPIVAWLRAGIPNGDGDGDDEDFSRKKSVANGEPALSSPPAAVAAAGFATRGAFAAAVLHTAREACAGVLRASSARLNAHTTAGLASRAETRSPVESVTDERLADGAPDATRDPGWSPVSRAFSVSRANPVHETPFSTRTTSVADIADESQFPSLGGARRRLDARSSSNANAYGEFALSSFVRESRSTGVSSATPLETRQTRRPTVQPKPPKRIQPTSTKLSLDAAGPNPRTGAKRGDERHDKSAESHERLVTPRRVAAVPAVREGEPPATPGSAVAAPPLRRADASASPGGSYGAVGSQGVVSASLFPASSADAEAEAEAEALFFERRNAGDDDSADDVRRTKPEATVTVATSFSLSTPLVSLALLHGAAIAGGVLPDLAPEMAFLCDVLAAPLDVVRVDAEQSDKNVAGDDSTEKNNKLVVDSGSAARRYAALVLSRSERAPHASGERALGALCASAALRRHAPALHASLVKELRVLRRREGDGEKGEFRDGDGTRGETFSCSFAAASTEGGSGGVDSARSMDAIDAAGPAPPRGGGGVAGGAGGFGGAANTEKAYRNREKSRDALYARLRSLAADGGGVGSIGGAGGVGGGVPGAHRHSGGGARGGRGGSSRGGHSDVAHGFGSREKAYELLNGVLPENTRWFAELFVSRLARAAAVGEADEELGAAVGPARLSKLHKRLTGESVSASAAAASSENASGAASSSSSATPADAGGSNFDQGRNREDRRAPPFASSRRTNAETHTLSVSSFACLFPVAQRPFVRLIESLDSHRLAQALQRALVAALHALDPNARARLTSSSDDDGDDEDRVDGSDSDARGSDSEDETSAETYRARLKTREKKKNAIEADDASFPPLTLSPGGVVPSPPDRKTRRETKRANAVGIGIGIGIGMQGGGVTERALAARAVAGVLGVLSFGSGAAGAGATSAAALSPPPGIDPATALTRASKNGGLLVTVPWVCSFYRFLPWDAEAATAACHLRALATLRLLRTSDALHPASLKFGAPAMALRAVLASGLSVAAPTTPAARAAFAKDASPPPPLASMPSLPPTRRDPNAYSKPSKPSKPSTEAAFGSVDRRYLEWACPSVDAAAARLARAAAAESVSRTEDAKATRGVVGDKGSGATILFIASSSPPTTPFRVAPKELLSAAFAAHKSSSEETRFPTSGRTAFPAVATAFPEPSTPAREEKNADVLDAKTPGKSPASLSVSKTRRVVASRVENVSSGFSMENVSSTSVSAETRLDGASSTTKEERAGRAKQNAHVKLEKTERALQRAFLARRPATRRVVEFVADAAALAAADAASAVAADDAAKKADAAVTTAATTAASAAPSGCAPDDAWSPALEDAVERAAMAAARDALAPASRRAAEDAARRAAAATEALLVPRRKSETSGSAETTTTRLEQEVTSAAAAASADAARIAASDRVRRTLPFEIHARVQSAARAKLRAALAEARSAKRALGASRDEKASETNAPETAEEPLATPRESFPENAHASRVSSATEELVARTRGDASVEIGFDASDARRAAEALRVALLATTGAKQSATVSSTTVSSTTTCDDDDAFLAAVASLADALAASLFHAPPKNKSADIVNEGTERLSAREWDDAADAAAWFTTSASRYLVTRKETWSRTRTEKDFRWDAFACAFFDPTTCWVRHMSSHPESPHTQKAAEFITPVFFSRILNSFRGDSERDERFAVVSAVSRAFRETLVAIADGDDENKRVGCVGVAVALRAGAALAEVLCSSPGERDASDSRLQDRRETELFFLFRELTRVCAERGERRTARRVENAARRAGFVTEA